MHTKRKTPLARNEPARSLRAVELKTPQIGPSKAPAPAMVTIVSEARLLRVAPGLHSLTIAALRNSAHQLAGMTLPAILITAPRSGAGDAVELIGAPVGGAWIDAAGDSVIMRAPAAGGHVLLTSYSLPGEAAMPLDVELQPVDAEAAALAAPSGPALRAEIVLHIEREGDRQFTASGWAGRLGSRRRVEALAIRPLEAISHGEVEYKVYSTGGRETPWVSDGRLCGTRGQGLPLTGFAVRLAPHLRNGFDVIYRGAFFASGPAPAARNGEACFAPLRDDPLEAVEIRIVERGSAR
jgi:hypothetical protein